MRALLLEQRVVVDRVVGTVNEQVLAVHTEPCGLGHVGREDLDLVAGVDSHRGSVLRADEDGLALALPQVAVELQQVVEPGSARLGVVELDRRPSAGDLREAILREDECGTDVADVIVAKRDHQNRRVVLVRAVRVGRIEP